MKTCKCGCGWPVFSHGYAKNCQNKRTDDKKPKGLRYTVHKLKGESLALRYASALDFGFEDQVSMFEALWEQAKDEKGNVICQFTGEKLNRFYGTDMWYSCFAHVLPKGRYTYWKLNPINICIVFPLFHQLIDQGTARQREQHPDWKWGLWYQKVAEMKEKYAQYKKDNMLP